MSEVHKRDGSHVIELFVPVTWNMATFDSVHIRPILFDHVERYQAGEYPSLLALLSELTHMPEEKMRAIGFIDFQRVMSAFTMMLPDQIKGHVQREAVARVAAATTAVRAQEPPPSDTMTVEEETGTGFDVNA